jgi:hypothetical protein
MKIKAKKTKKKDNEEMDLEKEWDSLMRSSRTKKSSLIGLLTEITLRDGDDGFDASDIAFQNFKSLRCGSLVDLYPKGSFVLIKKWRCERWRRACEITVLSIVKTFEENVPFGGDELPRIAKKKKKFFSLAGRLIGVQKMVLKYRQLSNLVLMR